MEKVSYRGDYLRGRFVKVRDGDADGHFLSVSPRDVTAEVGRFPYRLAAIDEAVQAARRAQPDWADMPLERRTKLVLKIKAQLRNRHEDVVDLICNEAGKPRWEAEQEVDACIAYLDASVEQGLALLPELSSKSPRGRTLMRPLGVVAVLGPQSQPALGLQAQVVPALLTGNAVVVKPPAVTPAIGQLYAEILDEADLPRGVFNLVQGSGEAGLALAGHPGLHGVRFAGSVAVADKLRRLTVDQPWKTLALTCRGKNPAIVLDDAPLAKAARDVLYGAYATAGQRLTSTSWVIVHKKRLKAFLGALTERASAIHPGDPLDRDTFLGPLSTEARRRAFLKGVRGGENEGAEALLSPGIVSLEPVGWYVSPGLHHVHTVLEGSAYQTEDVVGPDLAVYAAKNLEEAVALANSLEHGLCASVFTRDEKSFAAAVRTLDYGRVNWNAPTTADSPLLPLGGLKLSGNGRAVGVLSAWHATHPISSIVGEDEVAASDRVPGLD